MEKELVKIIVNAVRTAPNNDYAMGLVEGILFTEQVKKQVQIVDNKPKTVENLEKRKYKKRIYKGANRFKLYTSEEKKIINDMTISLLTKQRLIKGRTKKAIAVQHYKAVKKFGNNQKINKKKRQKKSSYKRWTKAENLLLKSPISIEEKIRDGMKHGRSKSAIKNQMRKLGLF